MERTRPEGIATKLFLLSIVFLVPFVFLSCESSVDHTYIIENNTNHYVEIELYSRYFDYSTSRTVDEPVLSESIVLATKNDEWIKRYEEDMATGVSVSIALRADSAVITYDNSKIQIFTLSNISDRNILYDESYTVKNARVKKRTHFGTSRYVLTEEDYSSAEEIENEG